MYVISWIITYGIFKSYSALSWQDQYIIVFSAIFVNCDQNEAQKQSFALIHGIQVLCASIWSHLTLFRLYFQQFGHIFAVYILLSDIKQ